MLKKANTEKLKAKLENILNSEMIKNNTLNDAILTLFFTILSFSYINGKIISHLFQYIETRSITEIKEEIWLPLVLVFLSIFSLVLLAISKVIEKQNLSFSIVIFMVSSILVCILFPHILKHKTLSLKFELALLIQLSSLNYTIVCNIKAHYAIIAEWLYIIENKDKKQIDIAKLTFMWAIITFILNILF